MSDENKTQDKQELMDNVSQIVGEINDLLQKSGYDMTKAAPEDDAVAAEASPEVPPAEAPPMEAPPAEAPPMEAPPAEAPPAEAPPMEAPPEEGGDQRAAMEAQAQELSDEELGLLLDVLMAEQEGRSAPTEAPPAEAPPEVEKSMKEDFVKLTKSVASGFESLKKSLESLQKVEQPVAPSKDEAVTAKPAMTNNSRVLEKSGGEPVENQPTGMQKLNKSQAIEFAVNQIRHNPQTPIDRDVVAELNLAKSQEDIDKVIDELKLKGVEFPK
jgi:hypothetical protein